mmetsp:Transcript_42024/g.82947  ORF Transcript_42024/g.82947 Transcript_42024/m.82947 type:complete len:148 (-) Transcript_42024:226-669(-)
MCDFFQIQKLMDLILENLYRQRERWPLTVVPFLVQLKPDILESPQFPFQEVVTATLPKLKQDRAEAVLETFPPSFWYASFVGVTTHSLRVGSDFGRSRTSLVTKKGDLKSMSKHLKGKSDGLINGQMGLKRRRTPSRDLFRAYAVRE